MFPNHELSSLSYEESPSSIFFHFFLKKFFIFFKVSLFSRQEDKFLKRVFSSLLLSAFPEAQKSELKIPLKKFQTLLFPTTWICFFISWKVLKCFFGLFFYGIWYHWLLRVLKVFSLQRVSTMKVSFIHSHFLQFSERLFCFYYVAVFINLVSFWYMF
jgi:hypothetical protein